MLYDINTIIETVSDYWDMHFIGLSDTETENKLISIGFDSGMIKEYMKEWHEIVKARFE